MPVRNQESMLQILRMKRLLKAVLPERLMSIIVRMLVLSGRFVQPEHILLISFQNTAIIPYTLMSVGLIRQVLQMHWDKSTVTAGRDTMILINSLSVSRHTGAMKPGKDIL